MIYFGLLKNSYFKLKNYMPDYYCWLCYCGYNMSFINLFCDLSDDDYFLNDYHDIINCYYNYEYYSDSLRFGDGCCCCDDDHDCDDDYYGDCYYNDGLSYDGSLLEKVV